MSARHEPGEERGPQPGAWIFYDGVCGLCSRLNRFVLARDRRAHFHFASLQSAFAREALAPYGKDPTDLDTFYLLTDPGTDRARLRAKSQAVVALLERLGGLWKLVGGLLGLVPLRLRERGYEAVARNRYRFFGKHEACPIPAPEHRGRFIAG